MARRTSFEVVQRGYGLKPLSGKLGFVFKHDDASEDDRTAGLILVHALTELGLDLTGMMDRVQRPLHAAQPIAQSGNVDVLFHGEVVVFTGSLCMPRSEAATLAAKAGCEVTTGVNKHTTLLVVGDQDIRALAGNEKSNKHRKAEDLIAAGKAIRIVTETNFLAIVAPR